MTEIVGAAVPQPGKVKSIKPCIEMESLEVGSPPRRCPLARLQLPAYKTLRGFCAALCRLLVKNNLVVQHEELRSRLKARSIGPHFIICEDSQGGQTLILHFHPTNMDRASIFKLLAPDQLGILCLIHFPGVLNFQVGKTKAAIHNVVVSINSHMEASRLGPYIWLIRNARELIGRGADGFPKQMTCERKNITAEELVAPLTPEAMTRIPYAWTPDCIKEQNFMMSRFKADGWICREVVIKNMFGIHGRPAAVLVTTCNKYSSEIVAEADGMSVNAKKIIGLLTLEAHLGKIINFYARGSDAEQALDVIEKLVNDKFHEE